MQPVTHHGNNVRAFREMLNIKQSTLADALNISQQGVSQLESRQKIDPETLEQISKTLGIPVEAIENLVPEKAVNVIASHFTNNHGSAVYQHNVNPVFNSVDEMINNYDRLLREKNIEVLDLKLELEKLKMENQRLKDGAK